MHHGLSSAGLPAGLSFDGNHTISGTFTGGPINSVKTEAADRNANGGTGTISGLSGDIVANGPFFANNSNGFAPDTITIRPPLHSICQLIANNSNGTGTNPLNFFAGYTINVSASSDTVGTVIGVYNNDSTVTVTATPNSGFIFVNWTEDGLVVSTSTSYTFTATRNRNLTANFAPVRGADANTCSRAADA